MQSSQEHRTTTSSCSHEESVGQSSIASQSDPRKRKHSKISADSEKETGPNYDILKCFPPLLCRYVFSHLNAKETLEMSKVNREWNKFVGQWPQVGKLWFKFLKDRPDPSESDRIILLNSEREYQNISIGLGSEASQFALEFLAQRAGAWKFVYISKWQHNDPYLFRKVLEIVEPTVEVLALFDVESEASFTDETSWTFPCLKSLSYVYGFSVFKPFVRVANLTEIAFDEIKLSPNAAADLQTILRNNHNLKEMTVRCGFNSSTSFEFPNEIKFKLQYLSIDLEVIRQASGNVAAFLATQTENLESLKLSGLVLDQKLLELILSMPKLKSLEINFPFSDDVRTFTENTSIESLHVLGSPAKDANSEERRAYQDLIKAMPSLKHFGCHRLDAELILCLLNFPALESLYTERLDILRVPECDVFPNLKHFESSEYPSNFEEPTADHNFAKLVKNNLSLFE